MLITSFHTLKCNKPYVFVNRNHYFMKSLYNSIITHLSKLLRNRYATYFSSASSVVISTVGGSNSVCQKYCGLIALSSPRR